MRFSTAYLVSMLALLAHNAALAAPAKQYFAVLQTEDIVLAFRGDEQGIRLTSLRSAKTGTEFLRLTLSRPSTLGSSSDAQTADASAPSRPKPAPFGNPFAVMVRYAQSPRIFQASTDIDILRWSSTAARLRVEFQVRGLLLTGEMTVSIGRSHSFWQCVLHNDSSEALQAVLYFPALSGIAGAQAFLPAGTGRAHSMPQTPLRVLYGDSLASPVVLVHNQGEGLYLIDNNRSDLLATADECYARSVLVANAPPEEAANVDPTVGPVVGMANDMRIEPGKSLTIGPIIVGSYQGRWPVGLEKAMAARAHIFRPHNAPRWLRASALIAVAEVSLPAIIEKLQTAGTNLLLLTGLPGPADESTQVPGLRALADQVHAVGAKLILSVNARTILQKSYFAQTTDGKDAACQDVTGKPAEPQPGLWSMCLANQRWQDRVADTCARLVRSYGADGIALTGLEEGWYTPCYARSHKHPSPFVGNSGLRGLLKAVRTQLDRISPDLVLLSSCPVDLAREYVDGVIVHIPPSFPGDAQPAVTRALCPDSPMYVTLPGDGARAEAVAAWAIANGLGVVVDLSRAPSASGLKRLSQYVHAVPELLTARTVPIDSAADSPSVYVQAFTNTRTVIAAVNLADDTYSGRLTLPDTISMLEDPLTGLRTERDADGRFPVVLMPHRAGLWFAQ